MPANSIDLEALLNPDEDFSRPEVRQATAQALRRQYQLGAVGQLMGTQPTQQAGNAMQSNAETSLKEAMLKQQASKKAVADAARQAQEDAWRQQSYQATQDYRNRSLAMQQQRLNMGAGAKAAATQAAASADQIYAENAANQIIAGLAPMPAATSRNKSAPLIREAVLAKVPDFDEATYPQRLQTEKMYGAGGGPSSPGARLQSANAVIQHIHQLGELGKAMAAGDTPIVNRVSQEWMAQTGQPAPANFDAIRTLVGDELESYFAQGGGTEEGRKQMRAQLDRAHSPQALSGVIDQYKHAMAAQMGALGQRYTAGHGTGNFYGKYVMPETRTALGMDENGKPVKAAPEAGASPFPDYPDATKGPDGVWRVQRNGKTFRVEQ